MFTKTITYTDFDGNERQEVASFHLTKAELFELETSYKDGWVKHIQRLVDEENVPELVKVWKKILHTSYGRKTDDGRRFVKTEDGLQDFISTNAYSDLFMELSTNTDAMVDFINKLVPEELASDPEQDKPSEKTIEKAKEAVKTIEKAEEAVKTDVSRMSREELEALIKKSQ